MRIGTDNCMSPGGTGHRPPPQWSDPNTSRTAQFLALRLLLQRKITTMVTTLVLSEYSGPPGCSGVSEKIPGGPLYDLARVQSLAASDQAIQLWTKKCARDVANLGWDLEQVGQLLLQLRVDRNYIDSEWCDNGKNAWVAADAYSLRRSEWVAAARKDMLIEYFVKFAIGRSGSLVLIVSCHT